MSDTENDDAGEQPCFQHLVVAGHAVDPATARDVARFRTAERARLWQARRDLSVAERHARRDRLISALDAQVPTNARRIALYWPIRGEPDLRGWMQRLHDRGKVALLPVVVEKQAPLVFRAWQPGCRMERGHWSIPVPAEGAAQRPDLVISPVVGVDAAGFRLGNGGGYYDRTLATLDPRPLVIGVGYDFCRIPTIYPMPWDIGMDRVVTDDGAVTHHPRGDR